MENREDKKEEDDESNEGEKGSEEELSKTSDVTTDNEKPEIESPEKTEREDGEGAKKKSEEGKQLKKVFLVMGFLAFIFLGVFLFISSMRQFTYEGLNFEVVKEGELIFYKTSLPIKMTNQITGQVVKNDYNIYLRNDPRKLEDVLFEGKINIKPKVVINFTKNFNCDGDGIIGVANLLNIFSLLQVGVEKNESLGCNKNSQYTFVRLQSGNETYIEQFHTNCYDLNINNCEVLDATEKYILELLIKANDALDK